MDTQCKLCTVMVTVLILLSVSAEYVHSFDDKECRDSNKTAVRVETCPKSAKEWKEAALRKSCHNIAFSNNCPSFEYHCVINAWINETIEVCAPIRNILGNVCAEYNFGGSRIQSNNNATCETCPEVYLSNMSFNYSECYDFVYKARNRSRRLNITTPPAVESTMKADNFKPKTSQNKKRPSKDQDVNIDMETKIIIPISFGIVAVIIFILMCLVHCLKKGHFLKGYLSESCSFQTRQKRFNTNENMNTDIESTPLKEVT